jgi:hypothetical protein
MLKKYGENELEAPNSKQQTKNERKLKNQKKERQTCNRLPLTRGHKID